MLLAELPFPIDYTSFHTFLIKNVPNADGLCTTDTGYLIIEKNPFTTEDQTNVMGYYESLSQSEEAIRLNPTAQQRVGFSISDAANFGTSLTVQYAASNVLQGITTAGKTQIVADYLKSIAYYLHNGSLYAAIAEINTMIADTSNAKIAVSPYITNDILYTYLNLIQAYLEIPLTINPGS